MDKKAAGPFIVKNLSLILFFLCVIAIISMIAFAGAYIYRFGGTPISGNGQDWAQFGDYFGGTLGALFAFLALLALLVTLKVQAYEVHLSTEELANSARALDRQVESLNRQAFENTFFQLLRLHGDIVSSIDLRTGGNVKATGRDCIKIYYSRLKGELRVVERGDHLDAYEGVKMAYAKAFDEYESDLGHYFRHLYRIFKFIDESDVDERRAYAAIVRAQLSSDELGFLFFNGISDQGGKFKLLMERYSVLENLRPKHVPLWDELRGLYCASAYGSSV